MKHQNAIGLDKKKTKVLADKLNILLANYSVFYQNVRGFHWNIQGDNFFELHVKFEELYNDLQLKIDEIAERILTLGYHPNHNFSAYLKHSKVPESEKLSEGKACMQQVVNAFAILIPMQRELLTLSNDANDEGTNALMSDYIRGQEKLVWMYAAYLK